MSHDTDFDSSGQHYQKHYDHPVCPAIELCEELSFNLGSALKYLWRAGKKGDLPIKGDLEDALWYLKREQMRAREAGAYPEEEILQVCTMVAEVLEGNVCFGVPGYVKKLARIVANHPQSSKLLRDVILSVANDKESWEVPISLVEQELAKLAAAAPAP